MRLASLDRLGRTGGALFVVLFLADVVVIPGEPDPDAGVSSIAGHYQHHGGAVRAVSLVHAVGGADDHER